MMPAFRLVPLAVADAAPLAAFEAANRDWFEQSVPPRPEAHFDADALDEILRDLLEGPEAGSQRLFLIRGAADEILGRINLTGIEGGTAQVGYRVGAAQAGRGLARAALGAMVQAAPGLGLSRLEARVAKGNPASERVLRANGFAPTGRNLPEVELHGAPLTVTHYARAV
ncbi:ribosomal-protein-alanine N-acetyltransferase [Limimaricola pyoseonensis]|uniref:Ribosomal-protein-alanine N-acetyltransferase n=2 Tax=Limimaricola pyoseonensis TaxID=521013 RepID=A0A1G7GAH2_9RHOB|nr:ribosomal-protein-alanine N-acetyltransferase [Limimaricola pyoseonensis]